jgi:hypothetical protein
VTAYALHLARDRVVIACDSAVYVPGQPPRLIGYDMKVRPLAHLRAAAFGFGSAGIIGDAIATISLAPQLDTAERVT